MPATVWRYDRDGESPPAPSPPTRENWLGTDDRGRDVLARIIYGFRISVLFGLTLTLVSSVIGVSVGAFMGYYGGKLDILGQRFLEVWGSLPTLFILIILSSIVQPNFWWLLGIMLLFSWMTLNSPRRLRARPSVGVFSATGRDSLYACGVRRLESMPPDTRACTMACARVPLSTGRRLT